MIMHCNTGNMYFNAVLTVHVSIFLTKKQIISIQTQHPQYGFTWKLLHREGVDPAVSEKFYRVLVQAVLLFGADTWVLLAPMVQRLEVVRVGLLRHVTKLKAKILGGGSWRKLAEKKYFRDRRHNRSRPTWTGDMRQWQSGWPYSLFPTYVRGRRAIREGESSG